MILAQARPDDAVGVVRLTHRTDDAVGSLERAAERVSEYRSRALPFFGIESIQDLLDTVTRISKAVASNPARRTVVICIGRRVLCPGDSQLTARWSGVATKIKNRPKKWGSGL